MYRQRFLFILLLFPALLLKAQPYQQRFPAYSAALNRLHEQSTRTQLSWMHQQGLMDIHLFNLSYTRGIGTFLRFKNMFHIAEAGSDIPWNMHPLQYLHNVIRFYEADGSYRVAILYYDDCVGDSLREVRNLISSEKPLDVEVQEMDELKNDQKPVNWGNSRMRVWYVSSTCLTSVRTPFSYAELMEAESLFRQELGVNQISAARSPRGKNIGLTKELTTSIVINMDGSRLMTSMLLPPSVLRQMEKDSIKGVIVIPYANIGQIPFLALPLEGNGDSTIWFADRFACTIAPHMCNFFSVLSDNREKIGRSNRLETRYPLVVGNPQYYSDSTYHFPDLPGAAWEARTVAEMLGTEALIGSRANYDSVVYRLPKSDMVYFATHAIPSFTDPVGSSFLSLTPTPGHQDGRLYLRTIQQKATSTTRLAILSACQTGVGKTYRNGYCNMGRGFYISGVDNTLMSLWNLDDNNIVPFMTTLVQELRQPQHFYPAENLRQAVLKYKASHPHPSCWAAMVNFGVTY